MWWAGWCCCRGRRLWRWRSGRGRRRGGGGGEVAARGGEGGGGGRGGERAVEAPLVLRAEGGVQVQVVVGGADQRGLRAVQVYARPAGAGLPGSWTRHASGLLGPAGPPGREVGI